MSPSAPRADVLSALAARLLAGPLQAEDLADEVPARVGRYEVSWPKGEYGAARVLLARDPLLGREVVVWRFARAAGEAERLQREWLALGRIEDPGLARVLDGGVDEDGAAFLVLERIEQPALGERTLTLGEAAAALEAAARACHAAHLAGIVHGELEPEQVRVGERTVVLGLGPTQLATGGRERGLPRAPEYAAPERRAGRPIGPAADVYSLGAMLYEQLAGAPPGAPDDAGEPEGAPTPVATRLPLHGDAPPALARLALAALAERPGDRPRSAFAFAEELRRWREEAAPAVAAAAATPASARLRLASLLPLLALTFALGCALGLALALRVSAPAAAAPPREGPRQPAWDEPPPRPHGPAEDRPHGGPPPADDRRSAHPPPPHGRRPGVRPERGPPRGQPGERRPRGEAP